MGEFQGLGIVVGIDCYDASTRLAHSDYFRQRTHRIMKMLKSPIGSGAIESLVVEAQFGGFADSRWNLASTMADLRHRQGPVYAYDSALCARRDGVRVVTASSAHIEVVFAVARF